MKSTNYGIMGVLKYEWPGGVQPPRTVAQEGQVPMQNHDTPNDNLIPYGFCHCGCGEKTNISDRTRSRRGTVKGQPQRFVVGHSGRQQRPEPVWSEEHSCFLVPLSRGEWAKVDSIDLHKVVGYAWTASASGREGYAKRSRTAADPRGGSKKIYMHRVITGAVGGDIVDHINGDRRDNRRENLRIVNTRQNVLNRSCLRSDNTSGYHGVSTAGSSRNRWRASITVNAKQVGLGVYDDPIDAAKARDRAATKYFGEFATLNFPEDGADD